MVRFWGLIWDRKCMCFPGVITICFSGIPPVTSKSPPDAMAQTRSQQVRQQSKAGVSSVSPRSVTTEVDSIAAAAYSGNSLKNAVPAQSPEEVCTLIGSAQLTFLLRVLALMMMGAITLRTCKHLSVQCYYT